ncbi:MAG: glycine-rich domain-containing protein, partial [Ilumatobacteraceae bacterium]
MSATGGNEVNTYKENGRTYKSHVFLTDGTFTIDADATFDILIVGGGGGGGHDTAGGGGAGGFYTATGVKMTPGAKKITVGAGGAEHHNGGFSMIEGITLPVGANVPGGGYGGSGGGNNVAPAVGGSGGGAAGYASNQNHGAAGVSPYGHAGGSAPYGASRVMGGGGGGAGGPGQNQGVNFFDGGAGGPGLASTYRDGTSVVYAKGGHGGARDYGAGASGAAN